MTPATILKEALADGVYLALSLNGAIKATGDQAAVHRWLPTIRENKPAIVAVLTQAAQSAPSRWWRLEYCDREPVEVSCTPAATHAEILESYPDAIAAEPFAPPRRPSESLTAEEETAVLAWLAHIGELDPATITEVLANCQADPEARKYFTGRSAETKKEF